MSTKDTKNIASKALGKDQLENVSGGFKYFRDYGGPYIEMSDEEKACLEKGKSTEAYQQLYKRYGPQPACDNWTNNTAQADARFLMLQGYKQEL